MREETVVWEGSPSQWCNFGYYFRCVFVILLLIIPVLGILPSYLNEVSYTAFLQFSIVVFLIGSCFILSRYLITVCHKVTLTDQRIIERTGVFSKETNEIEIYRIKDIRLIEPFWYRLISLSNLVIESTDLNYPLYVIVGLYNGKDIKEKLRNAVDLRRDLKGVTEID